MKFTVILLVVLFSYTTLSAQAYSQRVIAESEHSLIFGFNMTDTARYKYSSNRRSRYHYGAKAYDHHYHTRFKLGSEYYRAFNPGDSDESYLTPDVQADTVWAHSIGGPANDVIAATYQGMKVVTYYDPYYKQNGDFVNEREVNSYNSQGQLIQRTALRFKPSSSTWDSAGKTIFHYDAQGRHESDSSFYNYNYSTGGTSHIWVLESTVPHSYDTAGNELTTELRVFGTSSDWDPLQKWVFTYYPDNKVKTIVVEELVSSMANITYPFYRDSFAYDNGLDFYTRKWTWTSEPVDPLELSAYEERTLNSQSLPDTVKNYAWSWQNNNWYRNEDIIFTYNTDNNPTDWISFLYVNGVATPAKTHHFYYESFDTTTSVSALILAADLIVYPNPANDLLNITWSNKNNRPVTTELFNAVGQKVSGFTTVWHQNTQQISLQHLADGLYILCVSDESGVVVFKRVVVKE